MREHELRRRIIEEMHLRRWPRLSAPSTILQILRIVDVPEREAETRYLEESLSPLGIEVARSARHVAGSLSNDATFAWERHTEGSSITLFLSGDVDAETTDEARRWIEDFPGRVIRATRIAIVGDEQMAAGPLEAFKFNPDELVSCRIRGGIRMWSDFRLHDAGYGQLLVAAGEADPITLSRIVQQLQELGNYRNMALLGLPEVRAQWTGLDAIEARLRQFALDVGDPSILDDLLLEQVSGLAGELATLSNRIGYRLDATQAYATLVEERLADLGPIPIAHYHSLADFIRRRFSPAVRTCGAHRERLAQLNTRASDLAALLRARINTRIENQNARLLESMERRTEAQLRLQQLVEGLSIFALAYYGIGLLGYVLRALDIYIDMPPPMLIEGVAVPLFMVALWIAVRWFKRRILGSHD
ncbi:hypothetical protein GCM10011371_05250 [Novosphingobium marinum]|uniref:Putative membrane-anchored protein n=1 Tax=Novosphingobium marinum TaxID=1514948 RepID=A0A7Y9XW70_9SPHN|nr:DUF3422 domain-containing protein [Novosphingobium marinum]NYH94213.1 putative membrane-anchored protein [Novosphingobium marinum]GGC20532.1 hypothetical protein GCM10011371_05250 [Novosphingobium marinum]